jgi:pimeloyl-ACP methyl ester carboxylesterase
MPVVLLHGNPETAAVWDLLAPHLPERPVRLSPPGFGAPLPAGFAPTLDGYRDWLIAELERIGEPADLVGHDWGGGHVLNVAMHRPDLVRTWASDIIGVLHPEYVWHPLAQIWQTPGKGEAWVNEQLARTPEERAQRLAGRVADPAIARKLAEGYDADMAAAILGLYRDAAQPAMARLGESIEALRQRPGLAILPELDDFVGTAEQRLEAARRAGARTAELTGLGHWWMTERDGRPGAEALLSFYASTSP